MKQVILVRLDLKMSKGKTATQVSHASVETVQKSAQSKLQEWKSVGSKKVVLKVKDEKELIKYQKLAQKAKLKTALITDAAKTHFKEPTKTCLAIGPDDSKKIDKITGKLKLL